MRQRTQGPSTTGESPDVMLLVVVRLGEDAAGEFRGAVAARVSVDSF